MSNSIYYASQALGYFYATQRVKDEYEVSATSSLDQQLANLTCLPNKFQKPHFSLKLSDKLIIIN